MHTRPNSIAVLTHGREAQWAPSSMCWKGPDAKVWVRPPLDQSQSCETMKELASCLLVTEWRNQMHLCWVTNFSCHLYASIPIMSSYPIILSLSIVEPIDTDNISLQECQCVQCGSLEHHWTQLGAQTTRSIASSIVTLQPGRDGPHWADHCPAKRGQGGTITQHYGWEWQHPLQATKVLQGPGCHQARNARTNDEHTALLAVEKHAGKIERRAKCQTFRWQQWSEKGINSH